MDSQRENLNLETEEDKEVSVYTQTEDVEKIEEDFEVSAAAELGAASVADVLADLRIGQHLPHETPRRMSAMEELREPFLKLQAKMSRSQGATKKPPVASPKVKVIALDDAMANFMSRSQGATAKPPVASPKGKVTAVDDAIANLGTRLCTPDETIKYLRAMDDSDMEKFTEEVAKLLHKEDKAVLDTFTKALASEIEKVAEPKLAIQNVKGYTNLRTWLLEKDNEYVGGENNTNGAPESYFHQDYSLHVSRTVAREELKNWIFRLYYARIISDNRLLSKLALLRGKTLGCYCKSAYPHDIPSVESKEFRFTCHAEILHYLINLFDHPEGEKHWKIVNSHWDCHQVSEEYSEFLMDDIYYEDWEEEEWPKDAITSSYFLEFLFDFKTWGDKKCRKRSLRKCLCFKCRKEIFDQGPERYTREDHYVGYDTLAQQYAPRKLYGTRLLPVQSPINKLKEYMRERRQCRGGTRIRLTKSENNLWPERRGRKAERK